MTYGTLAASSWERSPALRGPFGSMRFKNAPEGTIPPSANQTTVPVPSSNANARSFIGDNEGLPIILVAAIVSVILVVFIAVREAYYRKYGVDMCPRSYCTPCGRRRRTDQRGDTFFADQALAEELQRQLNEEERESDRLAKRKERHMWYQFYMQKHSMIVEKNNLFFAKDLENASGTEDGSINDMEGHSSILCSKEQASLAKKLRAMSTGEVSEDECMVDSADEEIIENGNSCRQTRLVLCDENDDDAQLYLKLPPKQTNTENEGRSIISPERDDHISNESLWAYTGTRHVEGQCALCIEFYEEGDRVAWSPLECTHAFHQECILQWLSKGKKHCPICRHWFVPGARIDDQKKAHGEAWERALAEMVRREKEDSAADDQKTLDPRVHENQEQLSDCAEQTDLTDVSISDQHLQEKSHATKQTTQLESLPYEPACRKSSETSEIDGMQLGEYEARTTTNTSSSMGGQDMDDLESQLLTRVQNAFDADDHEFESD